MTMCLLQDSHGLGHLMMSKSGPRAVGFSPGQRDACMISWLDADPSS